MFPRQSRPGQPGQPGRPAAWDATPPGDPALFLAKITAVSGTGAAAKYAFAEQQISDAGAAEDRTSGRAATVAENPARYAGGGTLAVGDLVIARRSVRDVNEFEIVAAPPPPAPAFSGARVTRTNDLSVATGVRTTVPMDAEHFDAGGYHDNVTNNHRLTAPVGGRYLVGAGVQFNTNSTGKRAAHIHRAIGVDDDIVAMTSGEAPTTGGWEATLVTLTDLAAGEWVYLSVLQTSGGDLTLLRQPFDQYTPVLWITPLG